MACTSDTCVPGADIAFVQMPHLPKAAVAAPPSYRPTAEARRHGLTYRYLFMHPSGAELA